MGLSKVETVYIFGIIVRNIIQTLNISIKRGDYNIMRKAKDYWTAVYNEFCEGYPSIVNEIVDWYPSAQMEITVRLRGGIIYCYNWFDKRIRILSKDGGETENCELKETDTKKQFAYNLYNKIRRMGMNQQKLSELTGISEVTISRYCSGKRLPNVHNLKKICLALKCSVYELVDMEYGEEE